MFVVEITLQFGILPTVLLWGQGKAGAKRKSLEQCVCVQSLHTVDMQFLIFGKISQ